MILHLPAMPNQRYKFETVEFADSIKRGRDFFINAAKKPHPHHGDQALQVDPTVRFRSLQACPAPFSYPIFFFQTWKVS